MNIRSHAASTLSAAVGLVLAAAAAPAFSAGDMRRAASTIGGIAAPL